MGNKLKISILLLAFCMLLGCATSYDARGVYHKTRKGENLLWISKSYGVSLQDLAEENNILNVNQPLTPGEKLYIPPRREDRNKKLPFEEKIAQQMEQGPKGKSHKTFEPKKGSDKIYTDHSRFEWPVNGPVISPFGIRHGRRHDGVDIKAVSGTPIHAADKGKVVYTGSMHGYGNLILIQHSDNLFTAYAHNKKNEVKEGQKVKQGQEIALVGRTGRATGAHLHFEVREGEKARNPLFFLPVENNSKQASSGGKENESE